MECRHVSKQVGVGSRRASLEQLNARINRLAHALLDLGIKKGAKVAILAFNCNQFMEVNFALAKIGGVAVSLNFRLHLEAFRYITDNSDAEAFTMGGGSCGYRGGHPQRPA